MHASPLTWLIRLMWLTLPVTLGDLLADSVAQRSTAVQLSVAVLAWSIWLAVLGASLVALPSTLIVLRVLSPTALLAGVVAASQVTVPTSGWFGLASAAVVAAVASLAEVGAEYLNGGAYGDERRVGLRPPAILVFGPIPALWVAMTVVPALGVLLMASRRWLLGGVLVLLGAAALYSGVRSMTRLTRRWLVFVPAGVTLVDEMAVAEPTLMRRGDVVAIGPAEVGTDALDLTVGATGLLIQIDLAATQRITPVAGRNQVAQPVEVASVLIAPSRPGALLHHAAQHRLRVTTAPRS